MKKSDIYEISIKILGIYLFFTSIGLLREVLTTVSVIFIDKQNAHSLNESGATAFSILSLANFLFVIVFASFLTFRTKSIVKFVCKSTDFNETTNIFADRKVIYEIALVIMGLLLITWTLPDFAFKLKSHIQQIQSEMSINNFDINFIYVSAIKIVVGLIAILNAKSLSKLMVKNSDNLPKE